MSIPKSKTRAPLLTCIALAAVALPAVGQSDGRGGKGVSFQQAQKQLDGRLEGSLKDLAAARERIASEKIPLSRTVSSLEDEVIRMRRDRERLLEVRDSRTIDLTSLRREVESLGEQEDFIDSRLNEFVRDFEGRLDISELARYEDLTAAAKLAEKNANLDAEGKRVAQLAVVDAALERLDDQLGGRIFAGEALSPDGVLTEGKFVALGPTVFYASDDGSVRGLVETKLNAADPVVVELQNGFGSGIAETAASGEGTLPLDATLGKALRVEKARKSLLQHIDDGGVVGYVIVALGIAAFALTGFKAFEILGFRLAEPAEVDDVLGALARGNPETAIRHARQIEGTAGEMLTTGAANADEKRGVLEELLFEKILGARPGLERFLPFLAMTAAAAPLLGLLGTVIGMIKTFQLITVFGTGDAKSLSSGISEALVTTELGLIVAIPTLVSHGALSRMAKRKLGLLEELSVGFVNGVMAIRHGDDTKPLPASASGIRDAG